MVTVMTESAAKRLAGPNPRLEGLTGLVIGMGVSGAAAAELLFAKGAAVIACERDPKRIADLRGLWGAERARWLTGELDALEPPADADFCVISPGVDPTGPFFGKLRARGVPVTGELELACRFVRRPILAVTGTNGKTTVVNMAAHILKSLGRAAGLVGNVGTAVSQFVLESPCAGDEPVVMEISSYQCETMEEFKPAAGAVTNLAPDHLDRYPSVEAYYKVKFEMARRLASNEALWMGPGVEVFCPDWIEARRRNFALDEPGADGMGFRGENVVLRERGGDKCVPCPALSSALPQHRLNVLAAVGGCVSLGAPPEEALAAAMTFPPLPHRLEWIREFNGVNCYNDSKATNIHAMEAALRSLPAPIRLIAGGRPKGESLGPVRALVRDKVAGAYLIGEAAETFEAAWRDLTWTRVFPSLEEAARHALGDARPGETVLLSPGCASWDMFRNYAERGERFAETVRGFAP